MCKGSWHYAVERESLWKLVISRKFGEEGGGWNSYEVREGYGVGFWKDIWCGNNSLREAFPSLFALVDSKDAWVADCWDSLRQEGGWNPHFFISFNDWEVEAVERLLSTLQGKSLATSLGDRVV